jgi:phage FluMu gp28-like protein
LDAVDQGLLDKIRGRKTTSEERQAWTGERRRRCRGEEQWAQEYMCDAVDAADAFLTYEMLSATEDADVLWPGGHIPGQVQGDLYLGMDIGRRRDISVIWIDEQIGQMAFTRLAKPLEKVPFATQKDILYQYLRHPQLRRVCIDETGIGMQLAEQAQLDFGQFRVEPVYFTRTVKEELAYSLRTAVESKTAVLPASQPVREDLHSLRKATTPSGNIRFDVESSAAGHGDYFWAKALATHAAKNYGGPVHVGHTRRRKTDSMLDGFN